jgi:hypothetical protein
VVLIREQELQRMAAGVQGDARLGLSGAEVQVVEVVRNRLVQGRQRRVDQEVMVPGIGLVHAGRRDAHVEESEPDDRTRIDARAVLHVDEVDAGVGRGGPAARHRGTLRLVDHRHGDALGHDRRIVRDVILVAEDQLQGMLAGGEAHLRLGLSGAEMQMVEVIGDRFVQGRRGRIDDEVVVPGIFPVETGRRHAHVAQPEMDGRLGRQRCSVLDVDEIDRRTRSRRRRSAARLRVRSVTQRDGCEAQQACR